MNVTASPRAGQHGAGADPAQSLAATRAYVRRAGDDHAEHVAITRYLLRLLAERNQVVFRLAAQWEEAEHARDHCAADAMAARNWALSVQSERGEAQGAAIRAQQAVAQLRRELIEAHARVAELEQRTVPRRRWSR
jgi:hypothetical protein